MKMRTNYVVLSLLMAMTFACTDTLRVDLQISNSEKPVQLALGRFYDMKGQLIFTETDPDLVIRDEPDPSLTDEGAFSIEQDGKIVRLSGGDVTGLVYGLNHIREELAQGKRSISPVEESPHYSFRAIKFNLPWSSYRRSEALQLHYETCRDTVFWESFLDMMVENQFNKLTLWNLHPFNYLVRLESYPDANDMSEQEFAGWTQFWATLFRMAKDRGIETYLVNWNIFVPPSFAKAHGVAEYCIEGEYFVDKGDTSDIIKDYTRECVKEVIDRYPDLTGLGITLGEAMGGMTAEERELWILDSFIEGMRRASRKIKFIHRVPLSAGTWSGGTTHPVVEEMTRRTLDTLSCVDGPITIELKYNWSHGHSSTNLFKVHGGKLTDVYWNPPPTNYRLAWMVRNEDFFILRWGQPDFIREHISLNSQEYVSGYFVGSETYIPAVDYFTERKDVDWTYAFERQWMFYKQWGRLLYNPDTPDEVFAGDFENRYPGNGKQLFEAQCLVGSVPLILASYWDATWDYTLYSEGMSSIMGQDTTKLISLKQLAEKIPMDTLLLGVSEYAETLVSGVPEIGKINPEEMADSMEAFCLQAIDLVSSVHPGNNSGLLYEKTDILTWANLGLYFAWKLRSAVYYQRFVEEGDTRFHAEAVTYLERATEYWDHVSSLTEGLYKAVPLQHYNRNMDKYFSWKRIQSEVHREEKWLKTLAAE